MLKICLVTLSIFITAIGLGYSTCHDTSPCEKVVEHLVDVRWDQPYHNHVKYQISNTEYLDFPDLSTDVDAAAATWTNILFEGARIPFNLSRDNPPTTTASPGGNKDGKNVIGWANLPWYGEDSMYSVTAQANVWVENGEIVEADIQFNYHANLSTRDNYNPGDQCIQSVATHEFGHFAGFFDVSSDTCNEYRRYTMRGIVLHPDSHINESVECEEIYVLWDKYNQNPSTD